MKRTLNQIQSNLNAAIMRMEDLTAVHPGIAISLENLMAIELRPALERVSYLLEIADD